MWMIVFWVLPLVAIVYLAWHIWMIDTLPLSLAQWSYEIGTSSIMVMLYLVMLFLVLDFGRLMHLVPCSLVYHNWQSALAIFVMLFGIFLYGNLHYKNKVRVPLELKSSKPLPREYRTVMLSDLHLGYHNPRQEFARWVDIINAEKPDF